LTIVFIAIAIVIAGIGGFYAFFVYRINQMSKLTFEEMLTYTTKNKKKAIIAIGVIKNGKSSCTMYGENNTVLNQAEHTYEIGSLTKTFTASLLFKAICEGKISLEDSIDKYLDLPAKDYYPTIKRLITHTSGYKRHYFESQMISNFFHGGNDFYKISKAHLIGRIGNINLDDKDYAFKYSNFGVSVVGAVLSEIYDENYTSLINAHINAELGLNNTKISDGSGDLGHYWVWDANDAYMSAGALTSTIEDMLKYAQLQMDGIPEYLSGTHKTLAEVNATSKTFAKMNIHIDSLGAAWVIDKHNNIIWHSGGTGNYNCYLGFDPKNQIAVVVLSNLSPNYRIPATVMGVKLLTDLQAE
jgi:CubicO group peptidase (beta-lactamase class C family)